MTSIIPRAIQYELGLFHVLILTEHINVPLVWFVLLDTQMPPRVWVRYSLEHASNFQHY